MRASNLSVEAIEVVVNCTVHYNALHNTVQYRKRELRPPMVYCNLACRSSVRRNPVECAFLIHLRVHLEPTGRTVQARDACSYLTPFSFSNVVLLHSSLQRARAEYVSLFLTILTTLFIACAYT